MGEKNNEDYLHFKFILPDASWFISKYAYVIDSWICFLAFAS